MLIYQGQAKVNPDGVESVTALLPTRAEAGAPCIVLWRNSSKVPATKKGATDVEPSKFGNFEAILEKDGNQKTKFKSVSSMLELEFSGNQKTLSLSFQPTHGGQILTIPMTLTLGDPNKSSSPDCEAILFGGSVTVENKGRGNLIAVILCEKNEKGSQKPILALIEWGSETAMAEMPLGVRTCQSQDMTTIPNHDESLCFGLNSSEHHFHGQVKRNRRSPPELLLHIRPNTKDAAAATAVTAATAAAWQTTQSYPTIRKYDTSLQAIVSRSKRSPHTKIWNNTGDDTNDIAPALVTVTIQESGEKLNGYNKGMAAAGLFVALLGVAACAAPPSLASVGWAVGIVGLLLAGKSGQDNFLEDPGKSHTRVLYPGDAMCRGSDGTGSNEIIIYRAYVEGNRLKITEYFLSSAGSGVYSVTGIINGQPRKAVTKDLFSFQFLKPQVLKIYRYITIPGLAPAPREGSSGNMSKTLPSNGLPKAGSMVWYDNDGKFQEFFDIKKKDSKGELPDVIDHFAAGMYDHSDNLLRSDIMALVQEVKPQLSSNMSIVNLTNDHNTPVLVMKNWKVSDTRRWIANIDKEENVLNFIKTDRRNWGWGYQHDSKGDLYPISTPYYFRSDFMTQSKGTNLYLPLSHKDWTYTSMVMDKP
jgi:hypothetical protein